MNIKKAVPAFARTLTFSGMAVGVLTEKVSLTFVSLEMGASACNYAAVLQEVMIKGLPDASAINITTSLGKLSVEKVF